MVAPVPAFEVRGGGATYPRASARLATAALGLALAAGLAGCARASATAPTTIAVGVNVSFDRHVDPLPFDPHAERLRAAASQLEALAGHAVAFRFDAALLPEYRAAFEDLFASAIESAAKDLGYLKEREPSAFAHGAPLLEHIDCRYDAAASDVTAVLDVPSRTLRVSVPPNAYRFLEEGTVARALVAEHQRALEDRYASLSPSAVPPAEREAYFRATRSSLPSDSSVRT